MNGIKAIETSYKGYRFRSRLEARWAVFFDALGLRFEYEPEGFELSDGVRYLPDFRVTGEGGTGVTYYEIKPIGTSEDPKVARFNSDRWAAHKYSLEFGRMEGLPYVEPGPECIQLTGDPVEFLQEGYSGRSQFRLVCPRCATIKELPTPLSSWNGEVTLFCTPCDAATPCGGGHPLEHGVVDGVYVRPHKGAVCLSTVDFNRHQRHVMRAAMAARSARFEHGECGAPA